MSTMLETSRTTSYHNVVIHGDCVKVMAGMPGESIDMILTDPPYLARYRSRDGRTIAGDDRGNWIAPAFSQMFRVLKRGRFCVSFYGWHQADQFLRAWRAAGFRIVGHLVFPKPYASASRFLAYRHEQAYLLAKGEPMRPGAVIPDVLPWRYTGNRLHPTQKPLCSLLPLITAFSSKDECILDPFCGSGSTLAAARYLGRRFCGIELQEEYWRTAKDRLRATGT